MKKEKSKTKCDKCNEFLRVGEIFYGIFTKIYCEKCQRKMGVVLKRNKLKELNK